jgi:hypothetical protein
MGIMSCFSSSYFSMFHKDQNHPNYQVALVHYHGNTADKKIISKTQYGFT